MLLRTQQLQIQLADALQGIFQFAVVAEPLLDERFLLGGKAELFGTAAGIGDRQDPDGMSLALGANGATSAVTDDAVEQGAAEDVGDGRERGGELGTGIRDSRVFHANK